MADKQISDLNAKTTPADGDLLLISDNASSFESKKITISNFMSRVRSVIAAEYVALTAAEVDQLWNN